MTIAKGKNSTKLFVSHHPTEYLTSSLRQGSKRWTWSFQGVLKAQLKIDTVSLPWHYLDQKDLQSFILGEEKCIKGYREMEKILLKRAEHSNKPAVTKYTF